MNVRELLRIGLSSKKVRQKVLVGIGTVFAILVLITGVWYEIEIRWLTPGERDAAKAALVEIDALQAAGSMNGKEFGLQEMKAQQRLVFARDAMRTHRDRVIVAELSTYSILTTYRWDRARFELEYPVATSSVDAHSGSTTTRDREDFEARNILRLELHKALD